MPYDELDPGPVKATGLKAMNLASPSCSGASPLTSALSPSPERPDAASWPSPASTACRRCAGERLATRFSVVLGADEAALDAHLPGPAGAVAALLTVLRLWVIGLDLYVGKRLTQGCLPGLGLLRGRHHRGPHRQHGPALATADHKSATAVHRPPPSPAYGPGACGRSASIIHAVSDLGRHRATLWTLALICLQRASKELARLALACGAVISIRLMSKLHMAASYCSSPMDPPSTGAGWPDATWVAVALAFTLLGPNLYWNWTHDAPPSAAEIRVVAWLVTQPTSPAGQFCQLPNGSPSAPCSGIPLSQALLRTQPWTQPAQRAIDLHPPLLAPGEPAGPHQPCQRQRAAHLRHAACVQSTVFLAGRRRWLIAGGLQPAGLDLRTTGRTSYAASWLDRR